MIIPGLYILKDRKTGYFYNNGELKKTPRAYTKVGAARIVAEYGRVKERKHDSYVMNYELRHLYAGTKYSYNAKYTRHVCDFDIIECELTPVRGSKGFRRGCKPRVKRVATATVTKVQKKTAKK